MLYSLDGPRIDDAQENARIQAMGASGRFVNMLGIGLDVMTKAEIVAYVESEGFKRVPRIL